LYDFNGGFISKTVSLKPGNYKLTQFHVLDNNKKVIYSSPLEGSKNAYLVDNPLSIDFMVIKDKVTKLSPEVLSTENFEASDFGYSTFTFNIVKTFDFLISVFVYNPLIENFELTEAGITVTRNEPSTFSGDLKAITNKVTVRDGSSLYAIEIDKPSFKRYYAEFTVDSLKSMIDKPLIVILSKGYSIPCLVAHYPFNEMQMTKVVKDIMELIMEPLFMKMDYII
jgi:hypothetical protein